MATKKKLVSLVEAVKIVNDAYGNDKEKTGRDVIGIKAIYNAFYDKRLHKYGSRHFRQVEVNELLAVFGPKQTAS